MIYSQSKLRYGALPLFLLVTACVNEPKDGNPPPVGTKAVTGKFTVAMSETGNTSIIGTIQTGPSPANIVWEEIDQSGSCRLYKPRVPFCDPRCETGFTCVEDGQCMASPQRIGVGKVTVTGIKTNTGTSTFSMDMIVNSYQAVGIQLAFPPFAEGEAVTFSAAGADSIAAFAVTAKGIAPLAILNGEITMADGQPITLQWTPSAQAGNSVISVYVDISHHGGTKGKILCEGPDNGNLVIAASLLDKLKALGVSGFPKVEITRKSETLNADAGVELSLESMVNKELTIPGLISCGGDEDCPDGQTCQNDLKCK